jgi:hypothetical protein
MSNLNRLFQKEKPQTKSVVYYIYNLIIKLNMDHFSISSSSSFHNRFGYCWVRVN